MANWRADIAAIANAYAGVRTQGWRANLLAIARAKGYSPKNWREAVRMISGKHGTQPSGWRGELIDIGKALGHSPDSWRDSLKYIREYAENMPPGGAETLFALNTAPKQPDALYKWLDTEIWDDSLLWID